MHAEGSTVSGTGERMTPTQVLALAMIVVTWLAIAFPLALRSRSGSVHGSVTGFTHAMSVLSPERREALVVTPQRPVRRVTAVEDRVEALRRLFVASLVALGILFVAALVWGGVFWTLSIVALLATGGYVAVLRRRKVEADRARAMIRSIRGDHGAEARPRRHSLPRAVGQLVDHGDWVSDPHRRASGIELLS